MCWGGLPAAGRLYAALRCRSVHLQVDAKLSTNLLDQNSWSLLSTRNTGMPTRTSICTGNFSPFFWGKALVRTDAAPTNTNSPPKTQTIRKPPNQETLPSRGYPPNTYSPCNPRPTFHFFLFNHLPRHYPIFCIHHSTHLPSNSNTLHPSPRTLFPLPARSSTQKTPLPLASRFLCFPVTSALRPLRSLC